MATYITISCGNCEEELPYAPISNYIGVSHIECSNCKSVMATKLQPFSYYNFFMKATILLGAFLSIKTGLILILFIFIFGLLGIEPQVVMWLVLVGTCIIRFLLFKNEVSDIEIDQSYIEQKLNIKPK